MAELLWPPALGVQRSELMLRDLSARSTAPFAGTARTVSRPGGTLLVLSLQLAALYGWRRALLQSTLAALRGGVNRLWCHDHSYTRRGSFPTAELLSNGTFEAGTAGWTSFGETTLSVSDQTLRARRHAVTVTQALMHPTPDVAVTAYAPYVWRVGVRALKYPVNLKLDVQDAGGANTIVASSELNSPRVSSLVVVPYGTPIRPRLVDVATGGLAAGDFVDVTYASLSRCALVDSGANALTYSDELNNGDWTKTRTTVGTNATAAPDDSATADSIVEDSTATNTHYVEQAVTVSATAADYCVTVFLKAGTRTWAAVYLVEGTGNSTAYVYVNLSTGAKGNEAGGANWTNVRAVVTGVGNGWQRVSLIARKTNAATDVRARIGLATGNLGDTYSGNGSSLAYAWRATLAASSSPVKGTQTVATAAPNGTAQTGAGLHLKGLPADTSGLLLQGDQVQIGAELCVVDAALDSDPAGNGYLVLHRPIRTAAANNTAVVIERPMGFFMLPNAEAGWSSKPGGFPTRAISAATVELLEAPPT